VLHHLLDRSVEEISRETGVPSGTVKARLVRGRKALAPHLYEFAGEGRDDGRKKTGRPGAARRTTAKNTECIDSASTAPKEGTHHV
jgi:RNA polymerase sigma-70 factor (ECF subfamily)